jgi:hypothetical protein
MNELSEPYELHLRGNVTDEYKQSLEARFKLRKGQDVYFHPLVPHNELLSRIAEHDIGLALERNDPQSRNLTITNKIMQFLQGGLAVIASSTKGQVEVAEMSGEAVHLVKSERDLASAVQQWMSDPEALISAKNKAALLGRRQFCWDNEEPKLIEWVKNILN